MTYKQISTIAFDYLPASQVAWLEGQEPDLFVEVTDGDESRQNEIQPKAMSLAEVLSSASYGQRIVFGEKPRRAPKGTQEAKAYFRGEYAYEVVEG